MNQLARILPRASRMADTFTVWRLRDTGKAQRLECGAAVLADVLTEAAAQCIHKDVLFIQHTHGVRQDKTLHAYVIRQGKPEWRMCPETKVTRQVRPEKPDLLFAMDVAEFAPAEAWKWSPGCDVVGADREIEA